MCTQDLCAHFLTGTCYIWPLTPPSMSAQAASAGLCFERVFLAYCGFLRALA